MTTPPLETGVDVDKSQVVDFLHDLGIALDDDHAYLEGVSEKTEAKVENTVIHTVELTYAATHEADICDPINIEHLRQKGADD